MVKTVDPSASAWAAGVPLSTVKDTLPLTVPAAEIVETVTEAEVP
jgi:hypothetical protein